MPYGPPQAPMFTTHTQWKSQRPEARFVAASVCEEDMGARLAVPTNGCPSPLLPPKDFQQVLVDSD